MNLANAKRLLILTLAGIFLLGLAPASVLANKPYLKAFGGDVFTGGWFWDSDADNCPQDPFGPYQDNEFLAFPQNNNGGIQTFAKTQNSGADSAGGASVEFAAFALGLIEGASADTGFYSSGALSPTTKDRLSFANDDDAYPWGGLFQGTTRQSHCIPDYFGTKQNPAELVNVPAPYNVNLQSGDNNVQFLVNNPSGLTTVNTSTVQIDRGRKVTLFIDGNAYIGGNIEYQNNFREDDVPKLAIVVKGNLYIGPNVTRLDGVFIAQPRGDSFLDVTADSGIIWTCHPPNNDPVLDNYPNNNCRSRLVVTGSLIAKQINMIKINGTIENAAASTAEDVNCADAVMAKRFSGNGPNSINGTCGNIAEIINYAPEMVIGGPFFNPPPSSGLQVQSLISLPPVF